MSSLILRLVLLASPYFVDHTALIAVPPLSHVLTDEVGGDLLPKDWIIVPSSWVVFPVDGVDTPFTLREDGRTHSRMVVNDELC